MDAKIKTNWVTHTTRTLDQEKSLFRNTNERAVSSKYFGVDTHSRIIPSMNIFLRTGRMISVPYIPPPVIDYVPETGIRILYTTNDILVRGRHLDILARWLCSHKVIWLRESRTGYGLESEDIFIQDIEVENH